MRVSKRVGEGKPEGRCTETGWYVYLKMGAEEAKGQVPRNATAATSTVLPY